MAGAPKSYWLIGLVIIIFAIITLLGILGIVAGDTCASCVVYNALGFVVIMLWSCIFVSYFIWASYFYNINFGISDKEWKKIEQAKNNRSEGKQFDPEDIEDEPQYNPYNDETFGLPPGTVRGMIAFTLLFGAIALLIVSFGMNNEIEPGNFFRDQFEFFKTAFLMMIAFYFGARSLKYLKGEQIRTPLNKKRSQPKEPSAGEPVVAPASPPQKEIVVIDSSNPMGEVATEEGIIPPIMPIDPMAPKKS